MSRSPIRIVGALLVALFCLFASSDVAGAQTADGGVEVMLAIDTSESMAPALDATKGAAEAFVASMPPEVDIGILTFADGVSVLAAPTPDRSVVLQQIASITTGGDTALYDAVVIAANSFTSDASDRVIVVLTDGADEGSESSIFDAVLSVDGVRVEAISLTTALTDAETLANLGRVTPADDDAAMTAAFSEIADQVVEEVVVTTVAPTTTQPAPPPTTAAPVPETTLPVVAVPTPAPPMPSAPAVEADPVPASLEIAEPESSRSTTGLWLGAGTLFVAIFVIGLIVFPRERVSKVRLGVDKPTRASEIGTRTTSAIDEMLERYQKRTDLTTALAVADISMKPAEFVAMGALVSLVAGCVGLVLVGPIVALVLAVVTAFAIRFYVMRSINQRRDAFAEQLPDVLQLVTTALRSGYGITQAMESVAEEAAEPARTEFAQVLAENRMGRDLSDALHSLADRMRSTDLEWVVTAIDINRETGGNLSEILEQVGATVRERGRMFRQIRTLTAEGRLSAKILTAMPFLLLLWQWRVNPENFELLTHGAGLFALCVAGVLILLGGMWVRKTVNSVAL